MKVIAFEGLFSYNAGFVRNGLLVPASKLASFEYNVYPWTQLPEIEHVDLIVGHSYGGGAALRLARKHPKAKVLLLDPRRPLFWEALETKTPDQVWCFYQRSWWLPGTPVGNHAVRLSAGHTSIPAQPQAKACFLTLIR